MEQKEIISQLQSLKSIVPDKRWQKRTKKEIIGPVFPVEPVLALSLFALFLTGILYYNYQHKLLVNREQKLVYLQSIVDQAQALQKSLVQTKSEIENTKEPEKILALEKEISLNSIRYQKIKEGVETMDHQNLDDSVFSAIEETESALNEIQAAYLQRQKMIASQLLGEFDNTSLTTEQRKLLMQAEKCYTQKDYSEALRLLIEISQTINAET